MFSGASQFAFAGLAGAGSAWSGVPAALLLGARNSFYGVALADTFRPRGLRRLVMAQFVIDETTALALAQSTAPARRYAFWSGGLILFVLWNAGSLAGALLGGVVDPGVLGLDAAAPAVFLALLWPMLRRPGAPWVALVAAGLALALVPLVPPGLPVIAAAVVALLAGIAPRSTAERSGER
jgi:predicted branched-subunit amino acid permease